MAERKAKGAAAVKQWLEWSIEEDAQTASIRQVAMEAEDSGLGAHEHSFSELRLAALVALLCMLFAGGWMWYRGSIDFHDDVAIVEVSTLDMRKAGEQQSYRQTSAFRRADLGWQGLASADDVWGAWQTWKTERLSIGYRQIDAAAVAEAAPKLDQLYDKLRLDFGVPVTATVPITIEVVSEQPVDGYVLNPAARTIQVPSPAMQSVPIERTAATTLYQSVVYPLTGLVLAQMEDHFPDSWQLGYARWKPFASALRFWAWWEAADLSAPGREELVRWLYQNGQDKQIEAGQALPAGNDRRCRTYPSWEVSPVALNILLDCKARLSPWNQPKMPTGLDEHMYGVWVGEAGDEGALVTAVTFETVIEYVVAAYGRDSLPRLIAAMREHDSWQSLIPSVFDTSAEKFEAGWQAYLASQYK